VQTTHRYEIELGKRVGPIELGMNRQEVISILGEPEYSDDSSLYLTDYYNNSSFSLDYTHDGNIRKGIQVSDSELIYKDNHQDLDLLSLNWEHLFAWMLENDPYLDVNVGTFISHALKISTSPKLDEKSGVELAESIVPFTDGYWPSKEEMDIASQRRINTRSSLEEQAKELGLEWFLEPESQ
jgi:hypothetical protein